LKSTETSTARAGLTWMTTFRQFRLVEEY